MKIIIKQVRRYEHLIALLRGLRALIIPSLCEGWSTTVGEAKALGVHTLLSDLPVHREQAVSGAEICDSHSASELAAQLAAFDAGPGSAPTLGKSVKSTPPLTGAADWPVWAM